MPSWTAVLLVLALSWGTAAGVRAERVQAPDGATSASAGAGEPAAEPAAPPIRIDAVVTDGRGRPVLDLRPSDFEVKVDGVAQALAGLEVRTPPRPRVFAFFLDEFHVSDAATARVRDTLTRFFDTHLRPADRVVLVKPLQPVAALRFSTDHTALRDSVASFTGRKDDLAPRSAFEEQFIGHAPSAVAAARAQMVTLALSEMAVQLGELQAERAALILVSEGFERGTQGLSRRQGRLPDLQGVVRAAGRFNFSVYALSPADVEEGRPGGATLEWLAAQTGGVALVGAGLEGGLDQVASDMEAYYELTLPAPDNDGRFRRVEVAATRAGVSVRTRPGYWAPLSSEVRALLSRSGPYAAPGAIRALRRSPLINAWVGLRPAGPGELAVVLSWVPAPRGGGVKPAGAPLHLDVTVRSEAGDVLFEGRLAGAGEAGGPANVARFAAPAGRVEFDMRVLGQGGTVLDTDVRDAYVPHFTGSGALALLPPELFRARTLPEYRRLMDDAASVPTPVRSFARSERLVVRVPIWQAESGEVETTARVLNRRGQAMRALEPLAKSADGIAGFDLPLAWLAPGEYYIEIAARQGARVVGERILFRVGG